MFCYFQFLNKDREERLGSHGNSRSIQEHPFFQSIDWRAVEERQMEPPQEPEMKEVSGTDSVFISCYKLLLKLHGKRGSNSLVESTFV